MFDDVDELLSIVFLLSAFGLFGFLFSALLSLAAFHLFVEVALHSLQSSQFLSHLPRSLLFFLLSQRGNHCHFRFLLQFGLFLMRLNGTGECEHECLTAVHFCIDECIE